MTFLKKWITWVLLWLGIAGGLHYAFLESSHLMKLRQLPVIGPVITFGIFIGTAFLLLELINEVYKKNAKTTKKP